MVAWALFYYSMRLRRDTWFAVGLTTIALGILFAGIVYETKGHFMYPQDDVYIHLSMARTLAQTGTWGIMPGEFVSVSSSPLWALILAASFFLIGSATLYLPLILNIVAVYAVVIILLNILRSFEITGPRAIGIVALVALVTPLGPFAFSGMEHAFHMVVVLLFVWALSKSLSNTERKNDVYLLLCMAPLVTGLRYEGAFVIAVACGLLLLRKRFALMFAVGALGALPIVLLGMYSLAHGGHFLPNTLLVKKNLSLSLIGTFKSMAAAAYINLKTPLFMLSMPALLGTLLYTSKRDADFWKPDTIGLAVITGAFLLQVVFGKLSWVAMFRYEAFLVLVGTLYLFISLRTLSLRAWIPTKIISIPSLILCMLLVLVASPMLRRTISWPYAVLNARDLYTVTYQYAHFFSNEYPDSTIGAIDIGMLSYFGGPRGVRVVDFWGLANNDITSARAMGTYSSSTMERIASDEHVRAAVLFDSWLGGLIPSTWPRVATWSIDHNVTIGSSIVSFYAPSCADAALLENRMRSFSTTLPSQTHLAFLDWKSSPACATSARVSKLTN